MNLNITGPNDKFLSEEKLNEFKEKILQIEDYDNFDVKAEDYLEKGYGFTIKKNKDEIAVNILTDKEAKKIELKQKLRNKINQKRNGKKEYSRKMKNEKKNVDKHLFKKYMKVVKHVENSNTILTPSDIINNTEKYGHLVSMLSNPLFSKQPQVCEYYQTMKEHLGLPDFKMPEINKPEENSEPKLNEEQETEEEDEEKEITPNVKEEKKKKTKTKPPTKHLRTKNRIEIVQINKKSKKNKVRENKVKENKDENETSKKLNLKDLALIKKIYG